MFSYSQVFPCEYSLPRFLALITCSLATSSATPQRHEPELAPSAQAPHTYYCAPRRLLLSGPVSLVLRRRAHSAEVMLPSSGLQATLCRPSGVIRHPADCSSLLVCARDLKLWRPRHLLRGHLPARCSLCSRLSLCCLEVRLPVAPHCILSIGAPGTFQLAAWLSLCVWGCGRLLYDSDHLYRVAFIMYLVHLCRNGFREVVAGVTLCEIAVF